MQLGCPHCHQRQTVEPSLLAGGEARVECRHCGARFRVKVREPASPPGPPPPPPDALAQAGGKWFIRRQDDTVIQFPNIRALYDYVVQGVVTIDDRISRGGTRWRPLRDVPELASLFGRGESQEGEPAPVDAEPEPQDVSAVLPVVESDALVEVDEAVVLDDEPAPREPKPSPARTSEEPARPKSPVKAWMAEPIDELGSHALHGAAEEDELRDELRAAYGRGPRRGLRIALFLALVVAVVTGAYLVYSKGSWGESEPVSQVDTQALPPSERGAPPPAAHGVAAQRRPASLDAGGGAEVAAVGVVDAGAHADGEQGADTEGPADAGEAVAARVDAGAVAPPAGKPDAGPSVANVSPKPVTQQKEKVAHATQPSDQEDLSGKGFDALMSKGNAALGSNPTTAIAYFQRASQLSPSAEPVSKIGWAYLNQGRTNEAILYFQKALQRSSRYASTYFGLAQALERSGNKAEAIKNYERYLESSPMGGQAARARQALERLR